MNDGQPIKQSNSNETVFAIGDSGQAGTYVLRIQLSQSQKVVFGRFNRGEEIYLKTGEYIYIGSALSEKGSTTLGNRIQRHLARSGEMNHHQLRSEFRQFCDQIGIHYTRSPADKTPFWNIDHLTNLEEAEIIGIIFIRSNISLENTWSEYIERLDETSVFAKGLGANDNEGHTHLQFSTLEDKNWNKLADDLPRSPF